MKLLVVSLAAHFGAVNGGNAGNGVVYIDSGTEVNTDGFCNAGKFWLKFQY